MAISYKDAGVDIDAGNLAVEKMKGFVQSTYRPEVLTDLGSFAGLFELNVQKYRQPVLLSGTDGVGTKLRVAQLLDKHDTVGRVRSRFSSLIILLWASWCRIEWRTLLKAWPRAANRPVAL